jgi:hypothetical protein
MAEAQRQALGITSARSFPNSQRRRSRNEAPNKIRGFYARRTVSDPSDGRSKSAEIPLA